MKPICVIAPYQELAEKAQMVISELNIPAEVVCGDLLKGLEKAREAVAQGAEVVVSRGGTASLLQEKMDVPVVEIQVSSVDVINAINGILKSKQEDFRPLVVGLVGYKNVIYGAETIVSVFNIDLHQFILSSNEEEEIARIKELGINLILGDASGIRIAEKCGIEGILIRSGKEAIASALLEAKHVADVKRAEQEKAQRFKAIVDFSHDGIVAVDKNDVITVFNPTAEKILGIDCEQALKRSSQEVIPQLGLREVLDKKEKVYDTVKMINYRNVAINKIPITVKNTIVGAVATFQDVTRIQLLEQRIRKKLHARGLTAQFTLEQVVAKSPAMQEVVSKARQFAATDSTVLITGESGTGKEMIAQGIHNASSRKNGPFIAINCAALPENLLESELFGYEEGAFTGARKGGKPGLFEMAHGGTLFLDEVGEMPLSLQARLLRVLQLKEVMRVGGDKVIPVDVRILSATNRNLREEVENKNFREDLYYRLNVLSIRIPPLRERPEDIPSLIQVILKKLNRHMDKKIIGISPEVNRSLKDYSWPGNVRELENVVERMLIMAKGEVVEESDLQAVLSDLNQNLIKENIPDSLAKNSIAISGTLEEMERKIIEKLLEEEGGNQTKVAKRLGIDRSTIWRKLNKK